MTYTITSKTLRGDKHDFVLISGSETVFISKPNTVTDEQVIQELEEQKAAIARIEEEERQMQIDLEAHLNG